MTRLPTLSLRDCSKHAIQRGINREAKMIKLMRRC